MHVVCMYVCTYTCVAGIWIQTTKNGLAVAVKREREEEKEEEGEGKDISCYEFEEKVHGKSKLLSIRKTIRMRVFLSTNFEGNRGTRRT